MAVACRTTVQAIYVNVDISLFMLVDSCIQCRFIFVGSAHLSPRTPCVGKDTFYADRLPRGIVTTSNFVRRWTDGHLAIHLETGPTVLPFGSGRDRIESSCPISRSLANEFHRALVWEWFASTGVYSCSHLLNCDAFMTAYRWGINAEAKKDYYSRGLRHSKVLTRRGGR